MCIWNISCLKFQHCHCFPFFFISIIGLSPQFYSSSPMSFVIVCKWKSNYHIMNRICTLLLMRCEWMYAFRIFWWKNEDVAITCSKLAYKMSLKSCKLSMWRATAKSCRNSSDFTSINYFLSNAQKHTFVYVSSIDWYLCISNSLCACAVGCFYWFWECVCAFSRFCDFVWIYPQKK